MIDVGQRLEIDPALIAKLGRGQCLCHAAHEDGSANRIDGDAVLEAASYGASVGILSVLCMWIRKKFRNRGKTKKDFAAEKEAAQINRSCGALEATLATYLSAAREGKIDEEALEELIEALSELDSCAQAGKLVIAGENELISIRRSLTDYTAAIAQSRASQPLKSPQTTGASEFSLIRDQLVQQKELLEIRPGARQMGSD